MQFFIIVFFFPLFSILPFFSRFRFSPLSSKRSAAYTHWQTVFFCRFILRKLFLIQTLVSNNNNPTNSIEKPYGWFSIYHYLNELSVCCVFVCGMIYTNNRQRTRQTIDARGVRNVIRPQDWSKYAGVEPKVQLYNLLQGVH